FGYANPAHENRAREIATDLIGKAGKSIGVYAASDLYPVTQDFARLNTVLVEAYAAEPSRGQFQKIADQAGAFGSTFDLRVMASHGGTISTEAKELARTLISGPIGGMVGAKAIAAELGYKNVMCSDIGGTSFDLGLITNGEFTIKPQPDMAKMMLKLPRVEIDSVGAGTGSYVRVNPVSKRIEIGPDSAGSRVGVCNPAGKVDTPTLSDCNVLLGYLNPNNFLGGEVILDPEAAKAAIKEQVADPLGLDVYHAAEGVLDLFEDHLRNEVFARIFGKGYAPEDYQIFSYGGGGPLHVAGYTRGLKFDDVLIPAWAAGFSAFGCACADFEYRTDMTVNMSVPSPDLDPGGFEKGFEGFASAFNAAWESLRGRIESEFAKSGIAKDAIDYGTYIRMQYVGQLNDVEIRVPFERITEPGQIKQIIELFEEAYSKLYSRSATSPELGYLGTTAILKGVVPVEKPKLPDEGDNGAAPPDNALKGERKVYRGGQWLTAKVYDMETLQTGNVIDGPAVIESPATTFVVPADCKTRLDAHRIFHLTHLNA
ncbi:MAG: hydantoinase/oxoprolinase family protein, partial [Pseudomonadota bacterium]